MSELLKFQNLIIFNFMFFYSYEVQAFYNLSCTSREPVPSEAFHKDNYEKVSFVKYVCVELARILHGELHLETPTEACGELVNIQTIYYHFDGRPEEISIHFQLEAVQNTIAAIEFTAYRMFTEFNNNFHFKSIFIDPTYHEHIYDSVDTAIHRLIKSGRYQPESILIDEIRKLKVSYAHAYVKSGLQIQGICPTEVPTTTKLLYRLFPKLIETCEKFKSRSVKLAAPKGNYRLILYIGQSEMAATISTDKSVSFMGSDGAYASIIVIIKHPATKVFGVAHIDSNQNTYTAITNLVNLVLDLANYDPNTDTESLSLNLIGGYSDSFGKGEEIYLNIMVVQLRKNRVCPATFDDDMPDRELRLARILAGNKEIINIYNHTEKMITIGPFDYQVLFDIAAFLNKPDPELHGDVGFIKSNFIPNVTHFRKALRFLQQFPNEENIFPVDERNIKQPRKFGRNEFNAWVRLN